jgi:hypothetical protein
VLCYSATVARGGTAACEWALERAAAESLTNGTAPNADRSDAQRSAAQRSARRSLLRQPTLRAHPRLQLPTTFGAAEENHASVHAMYEAALSSANR